MLRITKHRPLPNYKAKGAWIKMEGNQRRLAFDTQRSCFRPDKTDRVLKSTLIPIHYVAKVIGRMWGGPEGMEQRSGSAAFKLVAKAMAFLYPLPFSNSLLGTLPNSPSCLTHHDKAKWSATCCYLSGHTNSPLLSLMQLSLINYLGLPWDSTTRL